MPGTLPEDRHPQEPPRTGPRFQMARIITALMLREISTTYGKSAGGYIWAILEPILGIVLLSAIFSMAMMRPAIGSNFPLFYASGLLPFLMFNDISSKVAGSIRFSRPFLSYSRVTFLDAMIARFLLNTLTHATIIGIVITGIFILYQIPFVVDMSYVFESILVTAMLGAGVGTINCYLITSFPVWERIWSILTKPMFLMSGIFFLYGMMPQKAQDVLWYNPLIHCVGLMRRGLYPTYAGDYISSGYVISISIGLLLLGLTLLERRSRILMER